tara:strand:+ start:2770 stop:2937 length:168 start_codon:yes stop_codon:yes gene_type:complete
MGNRKKRWIHLELDEAIKKEAKRTKKRPLDITKELGIKLKKKKKKKQEWGFKFRV